jgi:hypothetical protein
VITEHIHKHQQERFTILAGEAHSLWAVRRAWPERVRQSSGQLASLTARKTEDRPTSTASSHSARCYAPGNFSRRSPDLVGDRRTTSWGAITEPG